MTLGQRKEEKEKEKKEKEEKKEKKEQKKERKAGGGKSSLGQHPGGLRLVQGVDFLKNG